MFIKEDDLKLNEWQFSQRKFLPYEIKTKLAETRIREWYDNWNGQVYLSYSGGLDSTALLHMIRKTVGKEVPAVFSNTGLEFPEIVRFARKASGEFLEIYPQRKDGSRATFKWVVETYGFPITSKENAARIRKLRHGNLCNRYRNYLLNGDERGKFGVLPKKWHYLLETKFDTSEKCCDIMKKNPFSKYGKETGRVPYVGTTQDEAVEFQTLRTVTFAENETMDLAVEAVIPGVSGNVPANTITIMASPINGVTAITNSEKTSGGAEEENDEDYYERIHAEFQDSQFYVANDADYIKWAKEVPGIGDCIVEPAVEGPGTVGLILVDSNGQPASSTLVTAVYNHIVSPNDRSKRLLPTGSSKLIVKSATVKTVDFACTGLVLDGVGLDDVISTFKTEMMAVYSAAKETNILRYNSARTVLSTITGVSDFIDFTMDGKRENIHLSSSEYADTGNVTFTLEGAET